MSADYNEAADDFVGETAALQEARTLGAFLSRCGRGGILAPQDLAGTLYFVRARARRDAGGRLLGDALRAQVVRDPRCAILARQLVRSRLGVALVRQLLLLRQLVEQALERLARLRARRELARKLGARVLASGEQAQCPRFKF